MFNCGIIFVFLNILFIFSEFWDLVTVTIILRCEFLFEKNGVIASVCWFLKMEKKRNFFRWILIGKIDVNINFMIETENHADDTENSVSRFSFSFWKNKRELPREFDPIRHRARFLLYFTAKPTLLMRCCDLLYINICWFMKVGLQ